MITINIIIIIFIIIISSSSSSSITINNSNDSSNRAAGGLVDEQLPQALRGPLRRAAVRRGLLPEIV